ncbi:hypothetical protein EDI_163120 [Entamoeba dispar SAW760]|uniref:Uncharacterized protein n=1 Tax=Entamoeba dispar (strain ATCC PRA-260 / SAW760) TaxID=370354 RepID=B0ECR3_ENTDS|nr:uncharacterized protein EDI_163120 [Entamoeba dispar SAW760]EDR27700.1 hypothetical protein EDI_163120 [Entamoeba dispar SAW760]|eukprot:EDR27700.1 hypothetical protein EDI_163120 [Entamoeba dispar SAW760]
MIIILLSLVNLVFGQVTGCMTRWYTAISDNIGSQNGMVASQVLRNPDCFSQINDYKRLVAGHLTNMECYVYEKHLIKQISDYNSSRCGQCLEITGPTQRPFVCMIAGTFKTKPNHNLTESDLERIVFVNDDNYNYIATIVHASANHATQVTVRAVSCPFQYNPSLVIIGEDLLRKGMVKVQVINSNTIHKYLIYENKQYRMNNEDGTYSLPLFSDKTVKLVSWNDRQIVFKNISTINASLYFPGETQFTELDRSNRCKFVPQNQTFGSTVSTMDPSPINRYFTWTPTLTYSNETKKVFNIFGTNQLIFDNNLNNALFTFTYPSVMKLTEIFKVFILRFNFKSKENILINSFKLVIEDFNDKLGITQQIVCSLDQMKTTLFENEMKIEVSLNSRQCEGFVSGIQMKITTGPTTNLTLKEAQLSYQDSYNEVNQCGFETLYCNSRECTPEGMFNKGCEPNCGSCVVGYQCNSIGKCVKKQPKNTRNSGNIIPIAMSLFIVIAFVF